MVINGTWWCTFYQFTTKCNLDFHLCNFHALPDTACPLLYPQFLGQYMGERVGEWTPLLAGVCEKSSCVSTLIRIQDLRLSCTRLCYHFTIRFLVTAIGSVLKQIKAPRPGLPCLGSCLAHMPGGINEPREWASGLSFLSECLSRVW